MSRQRLIGVFATACVVLVFVIAMERCCEVFALVRGYDLCRVPSFYELFPYLLIGILPAFFLPIKSKASSGITWIVYLMHTLGIVCAAPYFSYLYGGGVYFSIFVVLTFILVAILADMTPVPNISPYSKPSTVMFFSFVAMLFSVVYIYSTFDVRFSFASLYSVYDVRDEFVDNIKASGSVLDGYVLLISGYSIAPIGIILAILSYQFSLFLSSFALILAITISLSVYSIAAFKSVAFLFFFVAILYAYLSFYRKTYALIIFIAAVCVFSLVLYIFGLHEDSLIHWFRRVFIVPGMNVQFYLNEFGFSGGEAFPQAPLMISQIYYDTDGSANAGIYGNGIARGGWLGILFVLSILYLILVFVDFVSKEIPYRVSISLLFPSAYALSNSSITTVILSYGLFVNVVFLYLLARSRGFRWSAIDGRSE